MTKTIDTRPLDREWFARIARRGVQIHRSQMPAHEILSIASRMTTMVGERLLAAHPNEPDFATLGIESGGGVTL